MRRYCTGAAQVGHRQHVNCLGSWNTGFERRVVTSNGLGIKNIICRRDNYATSTLQIMNEQDMCLTALALRYTQQRLFGRNTRRLILK